MNAPRRPIVGIDLGTTYSAIAHVTDDGRAEIIRDLQDARTTPSVVFLDDDKAVVGASAREQAEGFPDRVVALVKRAIGSSKTFPVNGQLYKPQVISGYVLKKLKDDAERALDREVTDAVITVPAYFGMAQRNATAEAGEFAGLNVRHILSEPTAAAIAFGMEQGRKLKQGPTRTLLVYDLGGGTFDVTLLKFTPTGGIPEIDVVSTDGDALLGGADWDRAMAEHVLKAFRDEHGADADADAGLMQSLLQKCEKAKFALSTTRSATVTFLCGDRTAKVTFDRELLKELTSDKLDRTMNLLDGLLAAKGMTPGQVDEVLLVGGSTKLVMVREALAERFGNDRLNTSLHPDLCVAQGAAWYGHLLDKQGEAGPRAGAARRDDNGVAAADNGLAAIFTDVCPFALGNKAWTRGTGGEDRPMIFTIIPKDRTLPCEETGRFATRHDNQTAVDFEVYENVSRKKDEMYTPALSRHIATVSLDGLPPGRPAGQPLDVTFRLDPSFRLHVTAVDVKSGRRVDAEIQYEFDMTAAERARATDEVQGATVES